MNISPVICPQGTRLSVPWGRQKGITYDAIGNPLTYGTQTFTWKHGRQLATLSDGTTTWSYTYDANGMRKTRTNGTDAYTYIYNGSKLTQMTKGTDTLYFTYDAFGAPWTVRWNGTVYTYMTNLQGDVIAIVNTSNTAVVEYAYDAWGNILSTTGTMADTLGTLNPLTYRGYVYDHEYGLYYLQSRYYSPVWGRFLNADALVATGQGMLGNNMFAYCNNNPVMRTDPTGTVCVMCFLDKDNSLLTAYLDRLVGLSGRGGGFSSKCELAALIPRPSDDVTGTTAYGISVSASFIVTFSFAVAVTFDERGNLGFMTTTGVGGGTPSAGIGLFKTKTNAPSINNQAGGGLNMGGSASVGLVYAGGEYNMLLSEDEAYHGYTVSAGVGVGLPAEFHSTYSVTNVWNICNIYEDFLGAIVWD